MGGFTMGETVIRPRDPVVKWDAGGLVGSGGFLNSVYGRGQERWANV